MNLMGKTMLMLRMNNDNVLQLYGYFSNGNFHYLWVSNSTYLKLKTINDETYA